jgi:hypothetical protein
LVTVSALADEIVAARARPARARIRMFMSFLLAVEWWDIEIRRKRTCRS